MFRLRRINDKYVLTYENEDYTFTRLQHVKAFILTIRKDTMK